MFYIYFADVTTIDIAVSDHINATPPYKCNSFTLLLTSTLTTTLTAMLTTRLETTLTAMLTTRLETTLTARLTTRLETTLTARLATTTF